MSLSPDATTYSIELFQSQQTSLLKEREVRRSAVRQNLSDIDDAAKRAGYPGVLQPEIDFAVALSVAKKDALCRGYEWDGTPLTEEVIGSIQSEANAVLEQSLAGLVSAEKGRIALKAQRTRRSDLFETEKIGALSRHIQRTICDTKKAIHNDLTLRMLEAKRVRKMANKSKRSANISDAAQKVLAALLAEFTEKNLGAKQLQDNYEGLSPAQLRSICCGDGRFSAVDFDLAMKELDEAELVKTGPMAVYENPPGSSVIVAALYSKNEYSYLTEEGYRVATRLHSPRSIRTPIPRVHISGGTFHQSPIGVGNNVSQTVHVSVTLQSLLTRLRETTEEQVSDHKKRTEIIQCIDALEIAPDQPSRIERYNRLVAVIADHVTVYGPLLTSLFQMLTR